MKPGRYRFAWASALFAALACATAGVRADAVDAPQAKIDDATRALEQAALQADIASDARELALLQQARDDLSAAVGELHGMRRTRAGWLLDDLEEAMQRSTAQLGTLTSPAGGGFDPRVPDRNLLAGLAVEAQKLERGEADVHRLIGTTVIGVAPPAGNAGAPPQSALAVANRELLAWPLGYETAWPQIRVTF